MTKRGSRRLLRVLLPLALTGCVVPGGIFFPKFSTEERQSRTNTGESVPDFIVAGQATRADVLLTLGEPDGTTEGDEQFVYTQIQGHGGVYFIGGGGQGATAQGGEAEFERRTYRRLVILFDDAGLVKNSRVEVASCISGNQQNCIDVAGRDLARIGTGEPSLADALVHGHAFDPARWVPGVRGFEKMEVGSWGLQVKGTLVVGEASVLFFSSEAGGSAAPLVNVANSQIAEVRIDKLGRNRALVLKRATGTYETFSIGGVLVDRQAIEAAAELI